MVEGRRASQTPLGRVLVVLPSALTWICNWDGLGKIAEWIAVAWRPVIVSAARALTLILPGLSFTGEEAAFVFFLLIIIVGGVVQIARGKQQSPSAGVGFLSIAASLVLILGMIPSVAKVNNPDFGILEKFVAILFYCLISFVIWRILLLAFRRFGLGARSQFLTLFISSIATLTGSIIFLLDVKFDFLAVLAIVVLSLPLLAPIRMAQLGSVVAFIAAVALSHSWLTGVLASVAPTAHLP